MLYPAAITSRLLSPSARELDTELLEELGELAEALLGAVAPAYADARGTQAARIIGATVSHLVGLGIATEDVSALIVQSETRGARSRTNRAGLDLVPESYRAAFAALAPDPVPGATSSLASRYATLRSFR